MTSWLRDLYEFYWLCRFPWNLLSDAERIYLSSRWHNHGAANRALLNPVVRYAAYRRNARAIQREQEHSKWKETPATTN